MRKYETFFIVDSELPDETNTVLDNKIQSIVASNGGEVLTYVPWGKRKLAYAIGRRTRGLYVLMEYAGGPKLVAELERNLRIDERVLKFITVLLDDRFDPEKERERIAAQAAAKYAEEDEAAGKSAGEEEEMPEDADAEEFEEESQEEE